MLFVFRRPACSCGLRIAIIICYLLRLEERLTISQKINDGRSLAYTIITETVIYWRSACLPVVRDDDHKKERALKRYGRDDDDKHGERFGVVSRRR